MAITPDTKNWTWVLERECPECRADVRTFPRERTGALIRDVAASWERTLADHLDVRARPFDDMWSPLEYACHVRDVFRLYDERLLRMLTEDDPLYENWDQDATAVAERYDAQDPAQVATQLHRDAGVLADHFDTVTADEWTRSGRRSDGARFTVESFARYLMHDVVHHLHDVEPVVLGEREDQDQAPRRRTRATNRGERMSSDAGSEQPERPAKKASNGRRRSTRGAKRTSTRKSTSARSSSAARKTTARKTTARKTTARKTTGRGVTMPSGPLATSLAALVEQLDAQITAVNDLSDTIDGHVTMLNQLRADQQLQVAALLEVHETASREGTLASYIDERLAELRRPAVHEADHPWPRR